MLQPVPTVPGTLGGEVQTDRGRLLVSLSAPHDRLTLLLTGADPDLAQLDAAGVDALRALLDDAARRMGEPSSAP